MLKKKDFLSPILHGFSAILEPGNDVAEQVVHGQVEDGAGPHLVGQGNVLVGGAPGILLDRGLVVDRVADLLVGAELVLDEAGVALVLRANVGTRAWRKISVKKKEVFFF